MLDEREIATRLAGAAEIAVDTNAVFGRKLLTLLDLANRINAKREPQYRLVVWVPALVHAERLYQERRKRKDDYDESIPVTALRNKGARIESFSEDDASRHGALLWRHFPTNEAWDDAKDGRSATVDWFIATHCEGRGWILVTGDRGAEFDWCQSVARPKAMLDALRTLAGPDP